MRKGEKFKTEKIIAILRQVEIFINQGKIVPIGNTDAHAKNFSLLHYDNGMIQLAPAYDILCTMAYEKHSEWMAMKIGSAIRISVVNKANWEEFATNIASLLGHSDIRVTASRYAHATPENKKRAIQALETFSGNHSTTHLV